MTLRFGTDGVRGVANRELTPEIALALGRALVRVLGRDPFLVARDTRVSGTMLEAALSAGICAEGGSVQSAGVLPTPGLAYLARVAELPAAMISASHNPYTDNGIKVFAGGGTKVDDEQQDQIEAALAELVGSSERAESGAAVGTSTRVAGSIDRYAVFLMSALEGRTLDGLRVVLDCANGAAYGVAPKVFRDLGAEVEVINAAPDGVNINVECGSQHPEHLQHAVRSAGAQVGFAFDGDADRMIAVDERGQVVDGDHVLAMCATDLQARGLLDHNVVVATVMSNLGLARALEPLGIELVTTAVGDRSVTAAMAERGAVLGGEESGHLVFTRVAPVGDGTLSALMVADLMLRSGRALSELASVVHKFPQARRNVTAPAAAAHADAVVAAVQAAETQLGANGRVLLRPSGTEPIVRVMVEAEDAAVAEAITDTLAAAVARAGSHETPSA
ncbi:MAG: phosphoglucosamine mutase [Acidimicrobiia bacterium]